MLPKPEKEFTQKRIHSYSKRGWFFPIRQRKLQHNTVAKTLAVDLYWPNISAEDKVDFKMLHALPGTSTWADGQITRWWWVDRKRRAGQGSETGFVFAWLIRLAEDVVEVSNSIKGVQFLSEFHFHPLHVKTERTCQKCQTWSSSKGFSLPTQFQSIPNCPERTKLQQKVEKSPAGLLSYHRAM